MAQAFQNADTDKSGTLSKDEIRNMLIRLGQSTQDITAIIQRLPTEEIDFEKFKRTVLLDSASGAGNSNWPHLSLHQKRACFERCVMHLRNFMGFAEMHINRSLRGSVRLLRCFCDRGYVLHQVPLTVGFSKTRQLHTGEDSTRCIWSHYSCVVATNQCPIAPEDCSALLPSRRYH